MTDLFDLGTVVLILAIGSLVIRHIRRRYLRLSMTDIIATTIEYRRQAIADNISKNNALLAQLVRRFPERKF